MKARIALVLTPFVLLAGLALAQKPAAGPPAKPADTAPAQGGTDARQIAFQKPSYPLDTCPVTHEKLGSMGEPVDLVVDGTLVRLCCKGCKGKVEKDKVAILKSIRDGVVAQQSVGYPMEKCAICDAKNEKAVDHVAGTRLVKLCCAD